MNITHTLQERGARYGDFFHHAELSQRIQDVMRSAGTSWNDMEPDQKQALAVIADKIARMLNGDPDYIDNWHDIIGYATLVENRLLAQATKEPANDNLQPLRGLPPCQRSLDGSCHLSPGCPNRCSKNA